MPAKGMALLVGLKSVNPVAYNGWPGTNGCWGCENDVDTMTKILGPDYEIHSLKTKEATSDNIIKGIESASSKIRKGDIFVFYYSGHGGQQYDLNFDDLDGKDETLVTYDRELVDDELDNLWLKFPKGVRIVMISDSCNSGSNYRAGPTIDMIRQTVVRVFRFKPEMKSGMEAQMIHYGGCRDGFNAQGQQDGGLFTKSLNAVWNDGKFQGNYPDFLLKIRRRVREMDRIQEPQYGEYGKVSDEFRQQKPFTIK